MNDSIIFQLRDLARTESNYRKRKLLKQAADAIDKALRDLNGGATDDRLRTLNGAWAFGARIMRTIYRNGGDDPAGRMTLPQQERKAA